MIKVSDFIVKFLERKKIKHVFGITGGGAMHLNDSFGKSKKFKYIMNHHEQAAAMAAEGYSRVKKRIGVLQVTTGPGGTNSITGVASAWLDSIPLLVISGQVATKDMIKKRGVRQIGVQEINIVDIVKPITKYAKTILKPEHLPYELEKAYELALSGRPGPTWIDIPLDIQAAKFNEKKAKKYLKKKYSMKKIKDNVFSKIIKSLSVSVRPTIVVGNGIHTSNSENLLKKVLNKINVPVLSS